MKSDEADGLPFGELVCCVPQHLVTIPLKKQKDSIFFLRLQKKACFNGSTWTWAFAEHQWDIVGNAVANTAINGNGTVGSNGTVDLFGWSTSTNINYNTIYYSYGINNSTNNSDYSGNFTDWGALSIYNPKTNTSNAQAWRTPTSEEWDFLFTNTTVRGSYRFLKANIAVGNDTHRGVILFPDNYDGSIGNYGNSYNDVSIDYIAVNAADWTAMETAGAAFLPAAEIRQGISFYTNGGGTYWSSSSDGTAKAYYLYFYPAVEPVSGGNVDVMSDYRYFGCSVRLVSYPPISK